MSRLHPFDFAFAPLADRFPAVVGEAGGSAPDLATFGGLPSVQELLQLTGPEDGEADPAVIEGYLLTLYAAFRFWAAGRRTIPVARGRLEAAMDAPDPARPSVPAGACYLELPERWFWARIDERAPHEPVEGLFVADSAAGGGSMTLLAVLGLRADRQGFSQLTATADTRALAAAAGCVRQPLFGSVVEGGPQAGVRSITSEAELVYLAHLALHSVAE